MQGLSMPQACLQLTLLLRLLRRMSTRSFIVWKHPEFARDLLPKHFK
jgi:hypothetical protein